ncbi:MAG: hypothetical protein IPP77_00295 [Bacteroidetes bacterium]|nr:hypothetical protein [Bacteroidota bacterium]
MRTLLSLLLFSTVGFSFESCGKNDTYPSPEIMLEYTSNSIAYSNSWLYTLRNEDNILSNNAGIECSNSSSSPDSILICYHSTLKDSNNYPTMIVRICKSFAKNNLVSINGCYYPKNAEDFFSVFEDNPLPIINFDSVNYRAEGVSLVLMPELLKSYSFANYTSVPPSLDTFNNIVITNSASNINWLPYSLNTNNLNEFAWKILVTINFRCKLYNFYAPHDSLLLNNGIFQGVFVDRNL